MEFFPRKREREEKSSEIAILLINTYRGLIYGRFCIKYVEGGGKRWYNDEGRV